MTIAGVKAVRDAYQWWLTNLSVTLVRKHVDGRPWRTMLYHTSNGLDVFSKTSGAPQRLTTLPENAAPQDIASVRRSLMGKIDRDPKEVLLRLSPTDVIRKAIRVPHAALDLMDSVVENKIETIVPWPQASTYHGYRIESGVGAGDQIDAIVFATSKQLVESQLQRAHSIGLTARAVDFAPTPEDVSSVELLSLEPDPVVKLAKRLHIALIGLACVSVVLCLFGTYQVWALDNQYAELDGKIASVMTRVEEVRRLNDENEKLKEQRERLAKRKSRNRPVMELVEALSRALPDSAYLEEFEIHDSEVRLVGKSADPTGLIGILERTPEFEDVRFSAPTTREDGQTLGTFSIVANIQQKSIGEKSQ